MAFYTKITVAGVDVSSYLFNYSIIDTVNEMTSANILFANNVLGIINFDTAQEIVVTNGSVTSTDYTIFKGYVADITKQGNLISLNCFDKLWILNRKTVNTSYDINIDPQVGVISAIVEDLIETYGGLTASVQNSGAVNTISKFICRNDFVLNRCELLRDVLDWQLYYNPTSDAVVFEPKGFTSFGTTLIVGSNIISSPDWEYDYTKIANDVTVIGGMQEVETTQLFSGTGAQTDFVLTFVPTSIKVYVGGLLQDGGVENMSATFDYSVDAPEKTVIFEAGSIPALGVNNIEVRYSYLISIKVHGKNDASITKYLEHEDVRKIETLITTEDAEKKLNEILTKFSEPIVSAKNIKLYNVFGLSAGMNVNIIDTINNETRNVNVTRVKFNFPEIYCEVDIDNAPIYSDYNYENEIIRRLEELERKNMEEDTLVIEVKNIGSLETESNVRYLEVQSRDTTPDNLWGNTTWGGGLWQSGFTNSPVTQRIIWPNRVYEETFFDTDFRNAGATTATWTPPLTFAATQVATSSKIWLNAETPTSVDITMTKTGTITFEVSGNNGANWETVSGITSGVQKSYNFINVDTSGVLWRGTESGGAAATISNLQVRINV